MNALIHQGSAIALPRSEPRSLIVIRLVVPPTDGSRTVEDIAESAAVDKVLYLAHARNVAILHAHRELALSFLRKLDHFLCLAHIERQRLFYDEVRMGVKSFHGKREMRSGGRRDYCQINRCLLQNLIDIVGDERTLELSRTRGESAFDRLFVLVDDRFKLNETALLEKVNRLEVIG